ncbi:MAG: PorT family protein [Bacteroidaceae bacterium]|nr:PorT family protein [Bacteroidaceae bacterium]
MMKHIHYYIIACLVAFFSLIPSTEVGAQKRKVMNRPYIDQRKFHYGFLAGVQLQDIELEQNGFMDEQGNQWFAEIPNYEPGFSVGILGEFYLNKHMGLRIIPSMHFGTKNVTFRNEKDGETQFQTIKSTYFSVPIDVKFAAERFNNYRPYVVAGLNPMLDLTVKKQKQYLLTNTDCYLELGMGCDFYLPFFKFIPEIKFLYGLSNVVNKKRTDLTDETQLIFTQSVNKARSKMIVLTFYFE